MNQLRIKLAWLRALGVHGIVTLVRHRIFGHRSAFLRNHANLFSGHGLEIGGPSALFSARGYAPAYTHARCVDNVNYAARTRWEGDIATGATFHFREGAAPGRQFVHEATELASIPDAQYDFLMSSHMLEHCANPIKALLEWKRAMKPGGALLLVLPHKDGTFDRYRPVTPLAHMVDDYQRGTNEDDRTHFEEILKLHDLRRDFWQPNMAAFRTWVEGNAANRGVHHHVFDSLRAAQLVDRAGFEIMAVEPAELESVFVFARKPEGASTPDNERFTQAGAEYLRASPFATDRV